jgi:hypothetical protein
MRIPASIHLDVRSLAASLALSDLVGDTRHQRFR